MIDELLDLSRRLNVSGSEGFASRVVHWLIDLDAQGRFVGLSPTVRASQRSGKELEEEQGKVFDVPVYYFATANKKGEVTATAGGGKAVAELGVGNVAEVFGVVIESKRGEALRIEKLPEKDFYKHGNFLDLHCRLAEANPDNNTIQAAWRFLSAGPTVPRDQLTEAQLKKLGSQQLSFRVASRLLLADGDLRRWWENEFSCRRSEVLALLPDGRDLFPHTLDDNCSGKLASVFPHIAGVPGGGGWCPLASFDKAPTKSFGLGDNTLPMRLETAERTSAALNWLLKDDSSHFRLGDMVAAFWAVSVGTLNDRPEATGFAELMAEPDPLEVREFLAGSWGTQQRAIEDVRFHAALFSSPQSRITVRSWHVDTLGNAKRHLSKWFEAIGLTEPLTYETTFVSISQLAACTVRKSKETRPRPATYRTLFEAAMFGSPVPQAILAAVVRRQSLELAIGTDKKKQKEFDGRLTARTALIQAYFALKRKGPTMQDYRQLDYSSGYWCGRMLAILDRIHNEAHDNKTNSSPANRSYGAASTTPALIFPQLCKLVRIHLAKVKGKRDSYGNKAEQCLEFGYPHFKPPLEGLADVCAKLRTTGAEFPRTLSLEQQGHFAIGFYYERSLRWPSFNPGNQKANETSTESQ